jgi:hypothetical protein
MPGVMFNPRTLSTGPKMACLWEFAAPWLNNGEFDVEAFKRSVGSAEAPIARNGYTGSQLDKNEHMKVGAHHSFPFCLLPVYYLLFILFFTSLCTHEYSVYPNKA